MIVMYSQRDKRWSDELLGNSKTTKIGGYGCKVTALTMCFIAMGIIPASWTPKDLNKKLRKGGAFFGKNGDLLDDAKTAQIFGLSVEQVYDINKEPKEPYTVKEVDMSPAPGKQQHFVFRVNDKTGKYIIDPWTGTKQRVGRYPFVSYRIFK